MAQHHLGGSWEKPRYAKIVEAGRKRIPNSLQLPATVLQHRIALDMHEFDTSNSKEGFKNVGYFLAVTGGQLRYRNRIVNTQTLALLLADELFRLDMACRCGFMHKEKETA